MTIDCFVRKDCRLCLSPNLVEVLRLTDTPLANEFVHACDGDLDKKQDVFPLYLCMCAACGHVQLPVVVSPERLFRNYVYVSGTSPVFCDHFQRYAESMIKRHGLVPGDLVVEIGSNDGTLLEFFQISGMKVIGVDPAISIAREATEHGIETWPEFFTYTTVKKIHIENQNLGANLVIANNVFAHVDDVRGMTRNIRDLLAPDGHFVFEVSYFRDVVEKNLYDTLYHEHLGYNTVCTLTGFFHEMGMCLVDVERIDTHGGSIRCTVAREKFQPTSFAVTKFVLDEVEFGLSNTEKNVFPEFQRKIDNLKTEFEKFSAENPDARIAGFGAPAKLTTLLYQLGSFADRIDYVIDDNPLKQGLNTPGHHIPVKSSSILKELPVDYLVIFAWNFADSIIAKNQDFLGKGGKFIIPLPEFKIISG